MVAWKVFCGVLLLLAVGIVAVVYNRQLRARRSRWPTCAGKILEARVAVVSGGDYRIPSPVRRSLTLRYFYTVGQLGYQGETKLYSRERQPHLIKRYVPGASVEVSYNEARPIVSEISDPSLYLQTGELVVTLLKLGFVALIVGYLLGAFS